MPHPQHSLAALLGSRICHDLISPIGAISNGVELLQMSGAPNGPELELIFESVENANARIRFFRIAFGVASPDQRIGSSEVEDILRDFSRGTRLSISWAAPPDLARDEVKRAFLMIQCFEAAMPWGGQISVQSDDATWRVTGQSERMKDIAPLWDALRDPSAGGAGITASEVQFLLLPLLLEAGGRRLTLDIGPQSIAATF